MIIGINGKIGSGKDTVGKMIRYLVQQKRIEEEHTWENWIDWTYQDDNQYEGDWQIKKFAGKLKQIVSILTGIPVEDLEKQEVKNKVLGEEWWYFYYDVGGKKIYSYLKHKDNKSYNTFLVRPTVESLLKNINNICVTIHPDWQINALMNEYKKPCIASLNDNQIEKLKGKIEYPNWIVADVKSPSESEAIKNKNGIVIKINKDMYHIGLEHYVDKQTFINLHRNSTINEKYSIEELLKANKKHQTLINNDEFDYIINYDEDDEEILKKIKEILLEQHII